MLTTFGDRWVEALGALGADWSRTVVIAGEDASGLGDACMRAGSSPIAAEGPDWVMLSGSPVDEAPANWTEMGEGAAGLVVLRRAWSGRVGLGPAVGAAARLLEAGGRLVVADLDLDRLLDGSTIQYPYRLRFVLDPGAEAALRLSTVAPSALAVEVGRASMRRVTGIRIDEERGRHPDQVSYWRAARDGGWGSLADLSPEEREPLMEAVAGELARSAPMGEIVERRPWFAATGLAG